MKRIIVFVLVLILAMSATNVNAEITIWNCNSGDELVCEFAQLVNTLNIYLGECPIYWTKSSPSTEGIAGLICDYIPAIYITEDRAVMLVIKDENSRLYTCVFQPTKQSQYVAMYGTLKEIIEQIPIYFVDAYSTLTTYEYAGINWKYVTASYIDDLLTSNVRRMMNYSYI